MKTATGTLLMDFLFRQCNALTITEIKLQLANEGTPLAIRTIRSHIAALCTQFPARCCITHTHHQYRRLPVKKYLFYPEQKKCNQ
ncbi:MAG TPA: hypothetical protein PK239_14765 [Chitinophagales bacterium]|nr:hypothetical protein [Chitinophagales bacterium]HRK28536.1 hypothetical protein [Chitinophagales bacterium]